MSRKSLGGLGGGEERQTKRVNSVAKMSDYVHNKGWAIAEIINVVHAWLHICICIHTSVHTDTYIWGRLLLPIVLLVGVYMSIWIIGPNQLQRGLSCVMILVRFFFFSAFSSITLHTAAINTPKSKPFS